MNDKPSIIRRFEKCDAKPRWWNIVREGKRCTTFHASMGMGPPVYRRKRRVSGAQTQSKDYASDDKAQAALEKQCQGKLADGFVEVGTDRLPARGKLNSAWSRVESWIAQHAPPTCAFPLASGASDADIAEAERRLGTKLPTDVRASYQRHDGSNWAAIFSIFGLGYWMPLVNAPRHWIRTVTDQWESMTSILDRGGFDDPGFVSNPRGPIRTDHWNRKWIPFTCSDTSDFLAIDLAPAPGGKKGQIIFWWHEVGAVTVVAESFRHLISQLADRLEAGIYSFDEGTILRPVNQQNANFDELLATFHGES